MTSNNDGDVPVSPTFDLGLPEFEGRQPIGVVTKLNGAGQRIRRPMHLEEKVVLVVEARLSSVGHTVTDDGIKRVHTLRVDDVFELEGKPGAALLRSLRQAYRLADDVSSGPKLPGMANAVQPEPAGAGLAITVDGSGTVVASTAADGDLLGLPHVDVAVLVFDDGGRALWPDDFADASGPHPEAGERIRKPGAKAKDDPALIRKVLDADTGETLEEWTDENEDARLRELEEAALAEEARGNREAVDELEAGRARRRAKDAAGPAAQSIDVGPGDGSSGTGAAAAPPLPGEEAFDHVPASGTQLLLGPEGGARAAGSIKADLPRITAYRVIEEALELESTGQKRKTVLAALEARAGELYAT